MPLLNDVIKDDVTFGVSSRQLSPFSSFPIPSSSSEPLRIDLVSFFLPSVIVCVCVPVCICVCVFVCVYIFIRMMINISFIHQKVLLNDEQKNSFSLV